MHIGLTMFPTDYAIAPHELAQALEARGFESLWLPEHTHIPASRATPYPAGGELPEEYWHTYDPFGGLCAAAVTTQRIKLATGICLLIERDTITTAKEAATVDRLSGGRLLFGVGAGWNREEMENHGTVYATRGKRLAEQVQALRAIWRDEEPEFHGQHVRFDKIWCYPKPIQQPGPPIIFGGLSPAAMARAVAHGDGWLPIHIGTDMSVMRPLLATLDQQLAERGRSRKDFSVSIYSMPPRAELIDAYRELGVDRVVLMIRPEPRNQVLAKLDSLTKLL